MEIWRGEATETNTRNNKSLRVTNLWSPSTSLQMRTDELEWELGNGSEPCDENRWAWVRVPRLYFHPPCLLPPHFHLVFIFRVYHISTLSLFSGSLGLNNLSVPYHISTHFHLVFIFRVLSTSLFAFSGVSTISSRSLHFHVFIFIFRVLGSQQSPLVPYHISFIFICRVLGSQQSPLGPYHISTLSLFSGSLGLNNLGPYLGPPLNNLPSHFLW